MAVVTKDKVRGLFLGTAIGDSLGMPVEGWSHEKIHQVLGRITAYVDPTGHRIHDGMQAGSWTDDTQLTIAVAKALIEAGGIDMDVLALHHVMAYKTNTAGWGGTTKEAMEKLANGLHWKNSGVFAPRETAPGMKEVKGRGFGNGVAMKAAPLGALVAATEFDEKTLPDLLAEFTAMTHRTSMAVSSCLAQTFATRYCLVNTPATFSINTFVATVIKASALGTSYFPETLNNDDITARFKLLESVDRTWTSTDIVREFGQGTYYVYNSLPFTYAFFVKDPTSIDMLYDCASAGGDTDSNASMLGALQGALNGVDFFPQHLLDGLQHRQELIDLADAFSAKFGIDAGAFLIFAFHVLYSKGCRPPPEQQARCNRWRTNSMA